MKCKWCKGTGGECGCGSGSCEHCEGTGEQTDPPYGAKLREVLSEEAVEAFAKYWCDGKRDETLGAFIQRVAQYALDHAKEVKRESSAKQLLAPKTESVKMKFSDLIYGDRFVAVGSLWTKLSEPFTARKHSESSINLGIRGNAYFGDFICSFEADDEVEFIPPVMPTIVATK